MTYEGFLAGTRLRIAGGVVPVEAVIEGELIATGSGALVPVTRLHRQRLDPRVSLRPEELRLVRITRGALGDGLPERDLALAPGQPVCIDGALIPAASLVNGATIVSEPVPELLTFFRVTLQAPATVFAEAVPVACGQEAGGFASPLITDGPVLERVKERLLKRAQASGFQLSHDAELRVAVGDMTIAGEPAGASVWRFPLPPGVTELCLLSRSCIGAWVWAASTDQRRLGVAVQRLDLVGDGAPSRTLPLDAAALDGFYPIEGGAVEGGGETQWRWTDGAGHLSFPATGAGAMLSVTLAFSGSYWLQPAAVAADAAHAGGGAIVFISGEPDTPGHVYRVMRPLAAARTLGRRAGWMSVGECADRLAELAAAETVVIWRAPLGPALRQAIDAVRAGGARLLFDIDDLMVDPQLARGDLIDAIRQNGWDEAAVRTLYEGIRATALACDGCLATTAELALHLRELGRPCWVLPNGFDAATLRRSRVAVRARRLTTPDGLLRIGYAGGSRTHQRDLAPALAAVARLLRARAALRLVLFRTRGGVPLVDIAEFPGLAAVAAQIEWREMVALDALPDELARFDINLAPLEIGNPFCEAKSELKFFEAALVEVCTVASPTGPFRRAIRPRETGMLADGEEQWHATLRQLVDDGPMRRRLAAAAFLDVLWPHGPDCLAERLAGILAQQRPGRIAARAFALQTLRETAPRRPAVHLPQGEVVHESDRLGEAEASIVIPLYNYAGVVTEALDSVWHQTTRILDLVVVDDRSTDASLQVALAWIRRHGSRFNRVVVRRNLVNSGLGLTRNAGFAAAETPFVLPLDADNRLLPHCTETCLQALRRSPGAAFAYPRIQQFGTATEVLGGEPFQAMRLAGGNYIDALALIARPAWAAVGGYDHVRFGWEDYDLWCRMAEHGLWGQQIDVVLAEYRVHDGSMLRTVTELAGNKRLLVDDMQRRHPWLTVKSLLAAAAQKRRLAGRRRHAARARSAAAADVPK
jgi:GT2 family glycosyltransferase